MIWSLTPSNTLGTGPWSSSPQTGGTIDMEDFIIQFVTGLFASETFDWGQAALALIGLFAVMATKTPNVSGNPMTQRVLDGINLLGMNFGKSKNGDQ